MSVPCRADLDRNRRPALFAWTMIMHPGRLPARVEASAKAIMPNRRAFFEELFLARPAFYGVRTTAAADANSVMPTCWRGFVHMDLEQR